MKNYAIISDSINFVLDGAVRENAGAEAARAMGAYRSAVQNPDISRFQLQKHLRRRARAVSKRARKHFWDSFVRRPRAND